MGWTKLEDDVVAMVREARNGRLRPHVVVNTIAHRAGVSRATAKLTMVGLISRGRLVYTYRDPCSFVELSSA